MLLVRKDGQEDSKKAGRGPKDSSGPIKFSSQKGEGHMGLYTFSPSPSGGAQESHLGLQEAAIGGVSRAPPLPLLTLALDFWKGRQSSHRLLTQ